MRDFSYIFSGGGGILSLIFIVVSFIFQAWMFIDAIRRQEFIWAVFIFFFSILSAFLYFFMVYRAQGGGNPFAGFELPGAADRRRIKQLQADIHYLDRATHHLQLADIYFKQGKLDLAETSYRAAYERDPKDEEIRAHLGVCLAHRGKAQEAIPLLESVCATNPKHEYGYTMMALAEAQTAAGQKDRALASWDYLLNFYSYARARVQYAALLFEKKDYEKARKLVQGVVDDAPYSTKFQRKQEATWISQAESLLGKIPRG